MRPDQWAILNHPATVKVLSAGRRWGKTVLGGMASIVTAEEGAAVAWVVPTYKNSRPLWRFARRAVSSREAGRWCRVSESEKSIEFTGGGHLSIYTADNPTGILGESFDLVVCDEAARFAPEVWHETIWPTLADRDGRALLISTPRGRNWFWTEWMRGQDDAWRDYASWQCPSSDNPNPNIKRAAIEARHRVPEAIYAQEWLAEFRDDSTVFRHIREAVDTKVAARPPVEGHRYVAGVDLARLEDFTVVTVMDVSTAPREVAFVDRFNQVSWQAQRDRIREVITRYKIEVVFIDQTGVGDPVVEQLRRDVAIRLLHGVQFTSTNKSPMVEALMLAFERGEVRLLDYPPMTAELLAYDAERLPSGAMRYNAPSGQHDDCVVSLMLAWEAAGRQRVGRLVA